LPEVEEFGACEGVIVPSRVSGVEARRLSREHVEGFVSRRYRPGGSPGIEMEYVHLVRVPYRVYEGGRGWPEEAVVVEGLTGVRGRVNDVPGLGRALTRARITPGGEKGGWVG